MTSHTGTETRSRLLREAAVGNIPGSPAEALPRLDPDHRRAPLLARQHVRGSAGTAGSRKRGLGYGLAAAALPRLRKANPCRQAGIP